MILDQTVVAGSARPISPDVRSGPCPPLWQRKPRFAIVAGLDFLSRSIGLGKPSDP